MRNVIIIRKTNLLMVAMIVERMDHGAIHVKNITAGTIVMGKCGDENKSKWIFKENQIKLYSNEKYCISDFLSSDNDDRRLKLNKCFKKGESDEWHSQNWIAREDYVLRCGYNFGICPYGLCCSKYGYCNNEESHCKIEKGCQPTYGKCGYEKDRCGSEHGRCQDGKCCSKYGYCNKTDAHCLIKNGCQNKYGLCKDK